MRNQPWDPAAWPGSVNTRLGGTPSSPKHFCLKTAPSHFRMERSAWSPETHLHSGTILPCHFPALERELTKLISWQMHSLPEHNPSLLKALASSPMSSWATSGWRHDWCGKAVFGRHSRTTWSVSAPPWRGHLSRAHDPPGGRWDRWSLGVSYENWNGIKSTDGPDGTKNMGRRKQIWDQ